MYFYSTTNKEEAVAMLAKVHAAGIEATVQGFEFLEPSWPRGNPGDPAYDSCVRRWGIFRRGEPCEHGFIPLHTIRLLSLQ